MNEHEIAQWNSHKLLFDKVIAKTGRLNSAVELGAGYFSTSFLSQSVDFVISLEHSKEWYEFLAKGYAAIANVDLIHWEGNPDDMYLWLMTNDISDTELVLIDNAGKRIEAVNTALEAGVPYILCHNYDGIEQKNRIQPPEGYRMYIHTLHPAWTVLWTTDIDLFNQLTEEAAHLIEP